MRGVVLLFGLLAVLAVRHTDAEGWGCSFTSGRKFTTSSGSAYGLHLPCKWHAIHAQQCGQYRIFVTPGNQIDEDGNQFMSTMFLSIKCTECGHRWSGHLSVKTVRNYVEGSRTHPFQTLFKSVNYDIDQIGSWVSEPDSFDYPGATFTADNGDFRVRFGLYDEDDAKHKSSGFEFQCFRDDPPKKFPEQLCGGNEEADQTIIRDRKNELGLSKQNMVLTYEALAFDKTAQPQYKDVELLAGGQLFNSSCQGIERAFVNRCSNDTMRALAIELCFPTIFGMEEKKCLVQDPETPTPNDVLRYCIDFVCTDFAAEPWCPHLSLALNGYSCEDVSFSQELRDKVEEVCPDVNTETCE